MIRATWQVREAAEERIAALKREQAVQLESLNRLHAGELDRQRELQRAAMSARERQFERQMEESSSLHKAQLLAYEKIEEQGGTLHNLATGVRESSEALQVPAAWSG